jgi:signal transduction histidine kinase
VTPKTTTSEHFDVHASVVFQLGESLISDGVQALLELIKNSYDADATYCKLTIDTSDGAAKGTYYKGALGAITVEDDGLGMSYADIRRGWLTISNSLKREVKLSKKTTPGGRTPLGDKGLGRLGTQRLGENLEMFSSQPKSSVQEHVAFSWNDFRGTKSVFDVPIFREELSYTGPHGTRIIITNLRDLELWHGTQGAKQLETGLSQLLSPFKEVRKFKVVLKVNGTDVELLDIGKQLRDLAWLRYKFTFDGQKLSISGKAKLLFARPEKGREEKAIFADLVERDNGNRFFSYLTKQKDAKRFSITRATDSHWFVEFMFHVYLDQTDKVDTVDGVIANPGPFTGEVDYFSLGREGSLNQQIFSDSSDFKEFIKLLSGIRVYRDGFGIRVPVDWLNLGRQWTQARSYYGLKPQNTVGYIAISARDNSQLEEKTDREGFKENAYYNNFIALLSDFVVFTADVQSFIRRGYNDYKSAHLDQAAKVTPETGPEELTASIRESLAQAVAYRRSLATVREKLSQCASEASAAVRVFTTTHELSGPDREQARKALDDLSTTLSEAGTVTQDVEHFLGRLSELEKVGEALKRRIEALRDEMQQVYELIGIGLTAEALSHEVNNIASHLGEASDRMARYLRLQPVKDAKILGFTENVKSSVAALRRQLLFLAPSLQYVREKRDDIDIRGYFNELYKHYLPIFVGEHISFQVNPSTGTSFAVRMNKGKLTQIIDNLLMNSEYWLSEDLRLKRISHGQISISFDKPFVWLHDNGRGIEPSIEESIFEPFVSAKGRGKGRGLGLYIARQLLESEGCSIRLLGERNQFGRRFRFEINLGGVLVGASRE